MLVMGVQGWLCSNPPRVPTKVPLGSPVGTLREKLRTGLLKVSGLQVRKANPHYTGMCVSHDGIWKRSVECKRMVAASSWGVLG